MTDPLTRAREAIARHESQHNQDPFHFSLTDHKYVALLLLVNYCEQLERDRSATALENKSLLEENLTMTAPPTDNEREVLGRRVREVWIEWAREQPEPKPSWLVPWDELGPADREVDMRIGEALVGFRQQGLITKDQRDPECVKRWPECESFAYDPRCCRFPKSCSAGVIRREDG